MLKSINLVTKLTEKVMQEGSVKLSSGKFTDRKFPPGLLPPILVIRGSLSWGWLKLSKAMNKSNLLCF